MFLLCVLVLFCYGRAEYIARALGKAGTSILMRLSAFILFAIGVQILWNGLTSGVPQMFSFLVGH
jgi:multiple antibiotic resistance protein